MDLYAKTRWQRLLSDFSENSDVIMWAINISKMKFVYLNERFFDITGYPRDKVENMRIDNFFDSGSKAEIWSLVFQVIKQYRLGLIEKPSLSFEAQIITEAKGCVHLQISMSILFDDKRYPSCIIGMANDITEKKILEETLSRNIEQEYLILKSVGYQVVLVDIATLQYSVISDNMLVTDIPDVKSGKVQDMLSPASYKKCVEKVSKVLASNERVEGDKIDVEILQADGSYLWVEAVYSAFYNLQNKPYQIFVTLRDISDRKHNERALQESNEKLQVANQERIKIFSILSHDLRNPIGAISNMAGYLKDNHNRLSPDRLEKCLELLQSGADKAQNLINDLSIWMKGNENRVEFHLHKLNIVDLVYSCVTSLSVWADIKGIQIITHIDTYDTMIFADSAGVETILRNLISNAIKFSFHSSAIFVRVEEYTSDADYLLISVKDKGVGMSAEQMENLFSTRCLSQVGVDGEAGSGLGLKLCKEFVERHNGHLWCESEESQGSTFYFTLPKHKSDDYRDSDYCLPFTLHYQRVEKEQVE